jgi:hypothetical protein
LNIRALLPISLERLIKILPILALSLCLPAMAQEQNGWQFDPRRADSTVSKTDAQQIYAVLLEMFDRWNAHDIELLKKERLRGCTNQSRAEKN